MTVEAPTDGDVFLAYLEHGLCPTLRAGQIVVMDKLSAHKVDGVKALMKVQGSSFATLPPYSPDINPIESCWSVVKARLRQLKARSLEALDVAIPQALALISPEPAGNCFKHCGYALG